MTKAWAVSGRIIIRVIGPNRYVFQIFHWRDKEKVLMGRPWCFDQNLLVLSEITGSEQPDEVSLTHSPFWVRIYNLPFNCRSDETIHTITSKIGVVTEVEKDDLGLGKFRRARASPYKGRNREVEELAGLKTSRKVLFVGKKHNVDISESSSSNSRSTPQRINVGNEEDALKEAGMGELCRQKGNITLHGDAQKETRDKDGDGTQWGKDLTRENGHKKTNNIGNANKETSWGQKRKGEFDGQDVCGACWGYGILVA
ncbi:Cysteine desulfurase IscS [Bienertia sinuspersici]